MKSALLYVTREATWKLAGLSLFERAVLPSRREGFKKFYLVEEEKGGVPLRRQVQRLQRWGIRFQSVATPPLPESYERVLRTDELLVGGVTYPVRNRDELREAKRALFSWLYQSLKKPTDGFILRYVNRRLSPWLTRLLVWTPLTPNQISFSVGVTGMIAGWLISHGVYRDIALGGILFQIGSILDCTDGEVARLKYSWSRRGQWVDTICDNTSYLAFLVGVFFGVVNQGSFPHAGALTLIMFGGLVVTLSFMFYYLIRYTDSGSLVTVAKELVHDLEDQAQYGPIRLLVKMRFMMRRNFFAFFFMLLCLANQLEWILILATIGANLTWIVLVTMKREFAASKRPLLQEE